MADLTKALRDNRVTYRWGYPSKLLISKDKTTYAISTREQGMSLLRKWHIEVEPQSDQRNLPLRIDPEWRTSTPKNASRPATRSP